MTVASPAKNAYFESLQVLRAFAALIVVIGHIKHEVLMVSAKMAEVAPIWTSWKLPYNAGVDIFFVLSGFLMVYTSQKLYQQPKAWRTFLVKRFQRIVPLYWFYTSAMIAVILMMPAAFDTAQASVGHFIQSYLFIPHERPAGGIKPLLSLGWTLNYEMFFYVIFAGLLFLSRRKLSAIIAILFIWLAVSHYFIPETASMAFFWSRPIIIEFIMGMIIANIYMVGFRLPKFVVFVAIAGACMAFFMMPYQVDIFGLTIYRLPNMTMAVGLVGALTLCHGMDNLRMPKTLKALGDSSYTLYLAHPFAIGAVALMVVKFDMSQTLHFWISLGVCVVGSYVAYLIIEKPMIKFFRKTA
jgi:exopolysaccharide production protein ExoZ